MTNSKDIFNNIVDRLCIDADQEEVKAIVYQLLETVLQITKTAIVGEQKVASVNWDVLNPIIKRINRNEPLQYILGQQEFYGRKFYVNPSVLIPRPETECLVDEVIAWATDQHRDKIKIVDIGTGSGCIAITLALAFKEAQTYGLDSSKAALEMAKQNAGYYGVDTVFYQCDILSLLWPPLTVDVVVSNPPYIPHFEKLAMLPNVLNYEPHEALFVPDKNPLLFYQSIAAKSKSILNTGGLVAVEVNKRFGEQVVALFSDEGYNAVTLVRDHFGNNRVVKAIY